MLRYTTATLTGALVTLGLFFLMQTLIALQQGAEAAPRTRAILDIWRSVEREDDVFTKEVVIDKRFIEPPELPETDIQQQGDIGLAVVRPTVAPLDGVMTTLQPLVLSDGPLVAIVRVQPVYPARAEAQGLEGHVIVAFDVLTDGTVANITIIESSHSVFDRAALRAAEKFRFKPRVVDGVPQVTTGVRNLFRFEMPE